MKHPVKKILSAMFVGCMLMSASAISASAAELQIQTATVYNQMSDGTFQTLHVDYTVAEDATEAEESEAAVDAAAKVVALAKDNLSMQSKAGKTRLASGTLDIPQNDGSTMSGAVLGCGRMPFKPSQIAFTFTRIDPSITKINIGLENRSQPNSKIYHTNVGIHEDAVVTFLNGASYNDQLQLEEDDSLVARFSSNTGSGSVRVKAYAYE